MGLEIIEIRISIEDEFGIEIPDAEAAELDTVGKLFDYILAKVDQSEATTDQANIWQRYITIISNQLNVQSDRIQKNHHFINDLGAG